MKMKPSFSLFTLALSGSLALSPPASSRALDKRSQALDMPVTLNEKKPQTREEWYINVKNERIPKVICRPGKVQTYHLRKSVEYLRGLSNDQEIKDGVPTIGAASGIGPRSDNCARVTCFNSSAIYWCNDTGGSLLVDLDKIADSVETILDTCPRVWAEGGEEGFSENYVHPGEEKHDGGLRVMTNEGKC